MMAAGVALQSIREAVETACRAPSLHNSQPWRWTMSGGRLQLHADGSRSVPVADPIGRQMVISCGAVLHHFAVVISRYGWGAAVERLPDSRNPMHLATVAFEPLPRSRAADTENRSDALRTAIAHRRTDRRPFAAPRPADLVGVDEDLVPRFGASLTMLGEDGPSRMAEAARNSASIRHYDPAYHAELYWWAGHRLPDQGIPGAALPAEGAVPVGREFPVGTLASPESGPDRAALAVISTEADTRLDWLRSGEALSHVLLTATSRGLATCPLTHLTEVSASRALVGDAGADAGERFPFPQIVVRIGARPGGDAPPMTGRRPVDEVWRA
ncbi:Acg family FMN-binding oxidoreductase [Rhodococcus sp. BE178]|uniref:Acg family FMN-binding oxidoreductase n=1 Tax=Rhodococcus sp. BE178 TaxID=2817737 RepID=UPI003D1A75C9